MNQTQIIDGYGQPNIVDCPTRIRRMMVRNLEEAKRERVNRVRARKAEAILKSIESKRNAKVEKNVNNSSKAVPVKAVSLPSQPPAKAVPAKAKGFLGRLFHGCKASVVAIAKRGRFWRPAHHAA